MIIRVVETRWGRLGLLICWDLQFPEAARILALKGADIIACPTLGWEDIYGFARAYENSLYIVAAMGISVNYNVWNEYMGTSCIVNPIGKKIASSQKEDDDIISATIDVSIEPAPQYGSGLITGHKSMRYTRTMQRRQIPTVCLRKRTPRFRAVSENPEKPDTMIYLKSSILYTVR